MQIIEGRRMGGRRGVRGQRFDGMTHSRAMSAARARLRRHGGSRRQPTSGARTRYHQPGADVHRRSACRKAKDLGYPHELWTTRLLIRVAA